MKRQRWIGEFWLCLATLGLVLLGTAASSQAQTVSTLAPGDVVKITVYGNPDLTTVARISDGGTITFPLIGEVVVGGVSTFEAEKDIAGKLNSGGFVRNAAVSIFVEERSTAVVSSATLLGQVVRSGRYSLDQGSAEGVDTLIGLLAKAGGTTENAADHCFLIRQQDGKSSKQRIDLVDLLRNGNVDANVVLRDGDVVLVPEMDVFYIYGEVQKPGRYRLDRDMTLMQALAVASGMTARGSEKGVVLNRQEAGGLRTLRAELGDRLQSNDVVYVKTAIF